jgi:hypothetical protein
VEIRPIPLYLEPARLSKFLLVQDLADAIHKLIGDAAGQQIKFTVRVEVGGTGSVPEDLITKLNNTLSSISDDLKLH